MPIVQFETGQRVNFDTTPTQADIDEVATKLGIGKKAISPTSGKADFASRIADTATNVGVGALKGAGSTLFGAAKLAEKITRPVTSFIERRFGRGEMAPQLTEKPSALQPQGTAQKVGYGAEQVGEFFVPAGLFAKGAKVAEAGIQATKYAPKVQSALKLASRAGFGAAEAAGVTAVQTGGDKEAVKTAATFGAAIPVAATAVGAGLRQVKKLITPKLLSYTSSVPEQAFNTLLQRREATKAAIGKKPQAVLATAQGATKQLRQTLSKEWQEGADAVIQEYKGIQMKVPGDLAAKLGTIRKEFGIDLPQNLREVWPVEVLSTLKKINELPKALLSFSPKGALVRETKQAFQKLAIDTFGGEGGSLANLYKNYSAKKAVFDAANDIVSAYKTGRPIAQTTALNRLMSVFNENKAAYLDAIMDLEKATGKDILSGVAGQKFTPILPKGTNLSFTGRALDVVLKSLAFPLTSPRAASKLLTPNEPKRGAIRSLLLGTKGATLSSSEQRAAKSVTGYLDKPRFGLSIEDVSKKAPGVATPKTAFKTNQTDLASEARRYKSAEEFVKARGKEVYHSTDSEAFSVFDPTGAAKGETYFNPLGDGLFLSKDKEFTQRFGKNTFEYVLPKDAKTKIVTNQKFQVSEYPAAVKGTLKKLGIKYDDLDLNDKVMINRLAENNPPIQALNEVESLMREDIAPKFGITPKPNQVKDIMQGIMTERNASYDAVIYRSTDDLYGTADEIIIPKNKVPSLKTKSQLTDIWDKAHGTPAPVLKTNKAEPLIEEARKYKSAEEFVDGARGIKGLTSSSPILKQWQAASKRYVENPTKANAKLVNDAWSAAEQEATRKQKLFAENKIDFSGTWEEFWNKAHGK